jgi:replicative DNA helicase
MSVLGKMFMAALLAEGGAADLIGQGPIDHLFKGTEEAPYKFIRSFIKQYGALPTANTILAHTGESVGTAAEPSAYYLDLLQNRFIEDTLKLAGKEINALLDPNAKDVPGALKVMTNAIMMLAQRKMGKNVVDFRHAYEIIMTTFGDALGKDNSNSLFLGWPYLDKMTGGLVAGDLVSFVGRPANGKTFFMLYTALFGWQGTALSANPQSRMFVSMEMKALPIEQRLAAIVASVNSSDLKNGTLSTFGIKKLKKGLLEVAGFGAPFWVVDGDVTASVEDIWVLARQLKPDAMFVDGGYILSHPHEHDPYKRVAKNVPLIKRELCNIAPTVVSWQFAKSASEKMKKKHGDKVNMDDIGYSDAIAQYSSLALGFMQGDTIDSIKHKIVTLLKGRNGEVGEFKVLWDFVNMDFSELAEISLDELQYP